MPRERLFIRLCSDRMRGNGFKLKRVEILNRNTEEEEILSCEGGERGEQVAQ